MHSRGFSATKTELASKAGFKFTLDIAGSRSANHIATRPVKSTSGERKTCTQTSFAADMKILGRRARLSTSSEFFSIFAYPMLTRWTQHEVKEQNTTKWTVIYSVKILIVIYWSAKAFNYAIYKHVSAAKLISTLEPAEDLADCGYISRDKIGTWLEAREAGVCTKGHKWIVKLQVW